MENRSLEQIEGDAWGDPPADATKLMTTVHELRRKPVDTLSPEDLRVLIGQKVGLDALVPLALSRLERDPLLEGDYYPGDVLVSVLKVPEDYWSAHPQQLLDVKRVIGSVDNPDLKADIDDFHHRVPR
jgi:hypothetical protein